MKALLADRKIQKLITRSVAVLILAIIVVLIIIPGVQNSHFSQLKKYNSEESLGEALKHKQEIADSRYYQTTGHVESSDAKIYRIGDFTTNVRGQGTRKLVLNLSVQYSSSETPAELKSKNPLVRNAIIGTCSDAQYLQSVHGKELLKENLKEALNDVITEGEITEIYFNRYIIQ